MLRAVENVNTTIAHSVASLDASDQKALDRRMIEERLPERAANLGRYLLQGLLVFGYKVIEGKYIGSAYVRKAGA